MKTLVCVDRDGTLVYDTEEHLFLGSTQDWKERIKILPTVSEGMKVLRTLPDVGIYMITNQSGIAIKDIPLLTEERAHEVCKEVLRMLEEQGARLDGYFLCPHVDEDYVKKSPDKKFEQGMVCECDCIKPRLGMVFDALKAEGVTPENVDVYVIGDRASDAQTALNIGGAGILIPFINEPGEESKVTEEVYIASTFLAAANYIAKKEASQH